MIKVEIGRYKAMNKGSLRGFFELLFPDTGMKITDCKHMNTDGRDWIAFPSKEGTKKDGTKEFFSLIYFLNKPYLEELTKAIVQQINQQASHDNATKDHVQDEPSLLW